MVWSPWNSKQIESVWVFLKLLKLILIFVFQKMAGGKKGNKGGGGNSGKKPDQPKPVEAPTFDFGGKDSGLVPIIQKKLDTLIGQRSGYFESLPVPLQNRIKTLKVLHGQKSDLDKQYKIELLALQAKFDKLIEPLYDRRRELVTGKSEPTEQELKESEKVVKEEKKEESKEEKKEEESKEESKEEKKGEKEEDEEEIAEDVKGIPNFWLEAFKHHNDFSEGITKLDEKVLKYLLDVRWKSLPAAENRSDSSFVLEFEFQEGNPYFSNKVLTKTYYLTEHEQLGETMFDKMEGTEIQWLPGKNVTVKMTQVQQGGGGKRGGRKGGRGRGKAQGGGKTITVEVPCESFFNFFKSDIASAFGIEDEEIADEDLQDLCEADYEMGLAVKEQIISSAVLWFTGEIEDPYGPEGEDDDDDEDGEYDSAEDPDFEPDPNAPVQQKPECAQQ